MGSIPARVTKVGVNDDEGPPVPIPNTEVKLVGGDNTCLATDREDSTMPTQKQRLRKQPLFYFQKSMAIEEVKNTPSPDKYCQIGISDTLPSPVNQNETQRSGFILERRNSEMIRSFRRKAIGFRRKRRECG